MTALPKTSGATADPMLEKLKTRSVTGNEFCTARMEETDALLIKLAEEIFQNTPGICIVAIGGYGRGELCPYSDIDIMFLAAQKTTPEEDAAIEKFLYRLWDKGLKVGHSVRNIEDCCTLSAKDPKVMTSLLDMRLLHGNKATYQNLHNELAGRYSNADTQRIFVREKLKERDERHTRYGDTRFVLEPNIKEGKGGLRDYQTLLWITQIVFGTADLHELANLGVLTEAEVYRFSKAHNFLTTVRCHLHEIAGRAEERLHFDIQADLAERLGYTNRHTGRAVERFMKHYFLITRDIGDMTRILIAAIEARDKSRPHRGENFLGFEIIDNRLMFGTHHNLKNNPIDMLRLFHVFQETGRDIHPFAVREISRHLKYIGEDLRTNTQANNIFLDILTSQKNAALTLRRMNEAGILGRFIPDFGRIIALMQFDRYHYYTVDEHTIHCIDILHKMENGALKDEAPIACDIAAKIKNRTALYVALFLHDICKGRGGRHAELGAELALSLGPRLGLSGEETDLVSWLVHEHLLMSDTAFRRNLNDPKTIADFSARIRRSPERLDMLFVLTTADIMGVGPGRWTAWKARLLEELYLKTTALMQGEEPGMMQEIALPEGMKSGETRIDITTDESQSATVVIVYTPDRPGLFATLCGALSAEGANIMRAYINTLPDRMAVDRFIIQNATNLPFRQERRQDDLRQSILQALDGTLDIAGKMATHKTAPSRKDMVFDIPPRIYLNNDASGTDTVIEIETRDRHGLLYDIACTFREEGLDIRAAKINTQGLRAIDSFYVQTAKRKKLTDKTLQARLIETLNAKVANP